MTPSQQSITPRVDRFASQYRRYARLKSLGLCTCCGQQSNGTVWCAECTQRLLANRRANAALRPKAKNLPACRVCGVALPSEISWRQRKRYCESCRSKKCAECGLVFDSIVNGKPLGILKFCSPTCYWKAKKKERGPLAGNWRGGRKAESDLARSRSEYFDWRAAVFKRDGYTCQDCGDISVPGRHVELNAHHIKEFAKYPELRMELGNGVTLCKPCHKSRHRKRKVHHAL